MSYLQLATENPIDASWEGSASKCVGLVSAAGCFCIIGSWGALGEIGVVCPVEHWGPSYADQFLGGGGEGYLREYVGELGILFFFVADAFAMLVQAKDMLGSGLTVVIVSLLVVGQVAEAQKVVVVCCGLLLVITVGRVMQSKLAEKVDDQYVMKRIAITGGLIVLLARQTVGPEEASPFWPIMLGRFVLLLPILQGTILCGKSGFQANVIKLGFPSPAIVGFLVFIACLFGGVMNLVGALISSFMCDLTFTVHMFGYQFWVIFVQGIAIPGAELLIFSLLVATVIGHIWPFFFGPTVARLQHWQLMIENGAVIGGLTYLTGSDVWSL